MLAKRYQRKMTLPLARRLRSAKESVFFELELLWIIWIYYGMWFWVIYKHWMKKHTQNFEFYVKKRVRWTDLVKFVCQKAVKLWRIYLLNWIVQYNVPFEGFIKKILKCVIYIYIYIYILIGKTEKKIQLDFKFEFNYSQILHHMSHLI